MREDTPFKACCAWKEDCYLKNLEMLKNFEEIVVELREERLVNVSVGGTSFEDFVGDLKSKVHAMVETHFQEASGTPKCSSECAEEKLLW